MSSFKGSVKPTAKPIANVAAEEIVAEAPDAAIKELIASKARVIKAHNADASASMEYISKLVSNKMVRTFEDLPGCDLEVLDGSMPGDARWDPLRLAETKTHLLVYREAEVKHGRLAMLGVAGWVAAELLNPNELAPSILNGGLGEVNPLFWLAILAVFANVETGTLDYQLEGWQSSGKLWKYSPGDLAFDPLDLRNKLAEQMLYSNDFATARPGNERLDLLADIKRNVEVAEVWHGRVAMLAITGFAFQEALWRTPVVAGANSIFFATPVWSGLAWLLHLGPIMDQSS